MFIKITAPDAEFYKEMIPWVSSPEELMQFAGPGFQFPLTTMQLMTSLHDSNIIPFKVSDSRENTSVGYAEIHIREQSAFLCRIIIGNKETRGKGIGTQLINLLLAYINENIETSMVELNVADFNKSAIRCYEKAGFVINPGIKTVREYNGRTWTSLRMQLQTT